MTHSHSESTALLDQQEALMDAIEKALETRRILDAVQKNAELALEHSLSGTEIPLELKSPVKAESQVFAEEIIESLDGRCLRDSGQHFRGYTGSCTSG